MITIDFADSPKGKPCIAMTIQNGGQWLLLTTRKAPMASGVMAELSKKFHTCSLPGIPLDFRSSLQQKKLIFALEKGSIGVYVEADKFDELVDTMGGIA